MANCKNTPLMAGEKNLVGVKTTPLGDPSKLRDIINIQKYQKKKYQSDWTDEILELCVNEFFEYCEEKDIKPFKSLLSLWIGVSYNQMFEWLANPTYGGRHTIMRDAMTILEAMCQADLNENTRANIFLLKTQHKYVEESSVNITNNTGSIINDEEIAETIKKLGL